jgi:hypothetical protein
MAQIGLPASPNQWNHKFTIALSSHRRDWLSENPLSFGASVAQALVESMRINPIISATHGQLNRTTCPRPQFDLSNQPTPHTFAASSRYNHQPANLNAVIRLN